MQPRTAIGLFVAAGILLFCCATASAQEVVCGQGNVQVNQVEAACGPSILARSPQVYSSPCNASVQTYGATAACGAGVQTYGSPGIQTYGASQPPVQVFVIDSANNGARSYAPYGYQNPNLYSRFQNENPYSRYENPMQTYGYRNAMSRNNPAQVYIVPRTLRFRSPLSAGRLGSFQGIDRDGRLMMTY